MMEEVHVDGMRLMDKQGPGLELALVVPQLVGVRREDEGDVGLCSHFSESLACFESKLNEPRYNSARRRSRISWALRRGSDAAMTKAQPIAHRSIMTVPCWLSLAICANQGDESSWR
jgi:hypothetical protein